MKLIRGMRNKSALDDLNKEALAEADEVWAAVAYVTEERTLLEPCCDKGIQLRLWARYDYSVPVRIDILKWFLGRSAQAVCKLVPDIFHPKVIWWRPFGAYIGSANLTDSAWFRNFEAGVFVPEAELEESGLKADLTEFFADIDGASYALTEELVRALEALNQDPFFEEQERFRRGFAARRTIPELSSLAAVRRPHGARERARTEFLREWGATLEIIRDIGRLVSIDENRPRWVRADVPTGVQADQFLHAYYYNRVMVGNRSQHRELHEENGQRREQALWDAILWWRGLSEPPTHEDRMMDEWAPLIAIHTAVGRLVGISEEDFVAVMTRVHAFHDYAKRVKYLAMGLDEELPKMSAEERAAYLSHHVYRSRTSARRSPGEFLDHVMYGGEADQLAERIFQATLGEGERLRHVGLSTLGELAGWAMPDRYPPRNGRTSKALFALGYEVTVHTE